MNARLANTADAAHIADIHSEGIEHRVATFETRARTVDDIHRWFDDSHPVVVVEDDGQVVAFASTSSYRPRDCYAGIAECSVYVARQARGRGADRLALQALLAAAEKAGYWKLVSRVFTDNAVSRALIRSLAFRAVGIYEKHGKLDGMWRDVVLVEKLIETNLR